MRMKIGLCFSQSINDKTDDFTNAQLLRKCFLKDFLEKDDKNTYIFGKLWHFQVV